MTRDFRPQTPDHEPAISLKEERLTGHAVYEGVLLKIQKDEVRAADGHLGVREYTLHPGAAAIAPMLPDGRLLLERQWRYPLNRSFLEFPAGKLEPHESPWESAQRELREETGCTANEWAYLGQMHPVISYSTEVIHLFLARHVHRGQASLEGGECLELVEMTEEDFFLAIQNGEVTDAKTLALGFWLQRVADGRYGPSWQSVPKP